MAARDGEEYNYQSLVNRWRRERSAVALSKMDGQFYEDFDKHLRELREEYQREHALNPATPKVLILQDELMNLQRVRDDIYDLREKKIVTAALIGARGGNPDRAHMTKEEEVLFDEVLRVLRDARRNLLRRGAPAPNYAGDEARLRSGAAKEAPKPAGGPPLAPEPLSAPPAIAQPAAVLDAAAAEPSPEAPLPGAPAAMQARQAPPAEQVAVAEEAAPARRLGPARTLVRVRADVPPFVGTDLRQYRLGPEDVAAVPKEIAHALIQRGLAQALTG